ncbi:MAG: hypothetical protein DWQ34_26010 [Planctomycetota bacterium]|nr:MAG: hypothetical protein DWQ34_26010 [Planctomycetota bacterium]REK21666.1 MAG: hypothetical protein DWQ41_20565 [Planctomycetota bacterium]REK32774.1 MAG: hypothetical protein DWQ45_16890 [Planctomycetota bacterium]
MFDPDTLPVLRQAIRERTEADRRLLDELRDEVRPLASNVGTIKPRGTTSVSLVASDGGNNKLVFDPFTVQLVRVVDSYGKELFFDAISPTTDTDKLSEVQFKSDGSPRTALGRMMADLGVTTLTQLSHMIPDGEKTRKEPHAVSPSWVLVYRDLCEWAVLYDRICYHQFATDTLIVRDGFLRSKLFRGELFVEFRRRLERAIERIREEDRRWVYLVGIAKHSKVLTRYQLAMAIERVMPPGEARYVRVPRELEAKAYVWPEYARGAETEGEGGEAPKYVAGDMYFVRFGKSKGDPVWAVDLFSAQSSKDAEIFGYLLADAIDGFPVPFYPRCLQKAHEHAQIVDFDLTILQDEVFAAVRGLVPDEGVLDEFQLNVDSAARRYE